MRVDVFRRRPSGPTKCASRLAGDGAFYEIAVDGSTLALSKVFFVLTQVTPENGMRMSARRLSTQGVVDFEPSNKLDGEAERR